jgi:prepilin-type processing-associated H-X9-DG protein
MSLAILGIGTALPPNAITQAEAAELAKTVCCKTDEHAAVLPVIYRQSAIKTRHMVFRSEAVKSMLATGTTVEESEFAPKGDGDDHGPTTVQRMQRYKAEALPLALKATRQALDRSGIPARAITHIVTVSCTGFSAPGVDVGLMKGLGLNPTVVRTHVGFMGCHGAINGLRVAQAFVDADPEARVLVSATELCSLHFHYGWDPKRVVANALFADGSAAVVAGPGDGSPERAWKVEATASCLFPDSEYAMTWDIGDYGFEMTLATKVPNLIGENLRPWLAEWLSTHGLTIEDIKSWAIHPGGPRILTGVEQTLGITEQDTFASREILGNCGNMSSPTVLFILDRLRERNAQRPCVAIGFGPGLVAEAALLR